MKSILVPLGVSVAAAAFLALVFFFWRSGRELRSHGVTAEAVVVEKYRKQGEGLENCYAVFEFTGSDHREHRVEIRVLSRAWHGLRVGEKESITYLPDRPEVAGFGPRAGRQVIGAFLLFMMAVSAAMIVTSIGLLVRQLIAGAGGAS